MITEPVTADSNTHHSSSTNIGAIVGGVVGGLAALALLVLLGLWFRGRRRFDEFDGDFDPDRVQNGTGPKPALPLDLGADTTITPFVPPNPNANMQQYQHGPTVTGTSHSSSHMSEKQQFYADGSRRPLSESSQYSQGAVAPGMGMGLAADWRGPSPGPSPMSDAGRSSLSGSNSNSMYSTSSAPLQPNGRYTKDREAMRYAPGGLALATQLESEEPSEYPHQQQQGVYGPPTDAGPSRRQSAGVVVHQDAGRIRTKEEEAEEERQRQRQRIQEEEALPEEIPPTYDSIHR
jgi:hypothetical protein